VAAQPKQDVRAVENPISAIIDLGDEVSAQLPAFRRMTLYALVFIGFFMVLLLLLLLAGLALLTTGEGGGLVVATLIFLVIGGLAFRKLQKARSFFRYFEARHRAIRAVRDEEEARIPPGPDPESRLLSYLATRETGITGAVHANAVQRNVSLQGRRGAYPFELASVRPAGVLRGFLGLGRPGAALFVRTTTRYPSLKEVMDLEAAVKDVCEKAAVPPTRAIWLVHTAAGPLSEDVYDYVVKRVIEVQTGLVWKDTHACSLQIVTELPDGTYDFIPFVAGGA
jgi:hypothetical protein